MMNLPEKIEGFAKSIDEASRAFKKLPSGYDLDRLLATIKALVEYASPFKVGDRVELTEAPECTGGWAGHEHCLYKGALGTIKGCDFDPERKCFTYLFEPDNGDLYKSSFGKTEGMLIIACDRFPCFGFSERWFKATDVPRPPRIRCPSEDDYTKKICGRPEGHDGPHVNGDRIWGEGVANLDVDVKLTTEEFKSIMELLNNVPTASPGLVEALKRKR